MRADTHYALAWRVNNGLIEGKGRSWTGEVISKEVFNQYNLDAIFPGLQGKLTYGHVSEHLDSIGISRANTRSVGELGNNLEATKSYVGLTAQDQMNKARRLQQRVRNGAQAAGATTENVHRAAAWWRGMGSQAGIRTGSASTMLRHGDYAELTKAEDLSGTSSRSTSGPARTCRTRFGCSARTRRSSPSSPTS